MKKLLSAVITALFVQPAVALPLGDAGSAVTYYANYRSGTGTGGASTCPSGCANPADLVYKDETRVTGAQHGEHVDTDYTLREQYASASHSVQHNWMTTLPVAGGIGQTPPDTGHAAVSYRGYADAGNTKLGAGTYAASVQGSLPTEVQAKSEIRNQVTIKSGTSGLNDGDTVRLRLDLRLDGDIEIGTSSAPERSFAGTDMSANLKIFDMAPGTDSPTFFPTNLVNFRAQASLDGGGVNMDYYDYPYSSYWYYEYDVSTNTDDYIYVSDSGDIYGDDPNQTYTDFLRVDTGAISVEFDAVVGHTLDIIGQIDLFTYLSYTAHARMDFMNTLAGDVTSTVSGLELDWLIPASASQPSAVPLPGTLALMMVGMMGFVARKSPRAMRRPLF